MLILDKGKIGHFYETPKVLVLHKSFKWPSLVKHLTLSFGLCIFQTVDVVIDQTYASDPAEYKLSTFLESINVDRDSCFSFVANRSIWRFDKRIGYSKKLGNSFLYALH